MKKERIDREVAELLATARPKMSDDWEARAQAAVSTARPRRSRRLTALIAGLAVLVLAAGAFAAASILWLPDEGTLYFSGAEETPTTGIVTRSIRHALRPSGVSIGEAPAFDADLSPSGDEWVYSLMFDWPPMSEHIVRMEKNGGPEWDLTEDAGVGGVNCRPQWSPDGTMIVFQHADPEPDVYPCKAGFHIWVMNADGSDAHRVTPDECLPTWEASWSPDGSSLLCNLYTDDFCRHESAVLTDLWGTGIQMLPNVGSNAVFSPDGAMIASSGCERGELDGYAGVWRQLLLTDADGSNPEVLLQQFVVDEEVEAVYPTEEQLAAIPDNNWVKGTRAWAGPIHPKWSPRGDKIAFLAALPFDPAGPIVRQQVDVWIYDLNTDEVIQVTDDDLGQFSLLWEP